MPTVATATGPLKAAIRSGVDGYCVADDTQWYECLCLLIDDSGARRRCGEEAFWHAVVRFGPEAQCLDGLNILTDLSVWCS